MGTLGATLRNARLAKGVTASQAGLATHIKVQIIDGLENDDFASIAAPIYGKGFIRIYADYLGVDSVPLIEEYLEQCGVHPSPSLGTDTAGVVEHPDVDAKVSDRHSDPAVSSWPKFEWSRLNVFRRIPLPSEPAKIKAMFVDEPGKCLLIGFGVVVLLVFLVSGLSKLSRHRSESGPTAKRQIWDPVEIGRELPPPYVNAPQ